MKIESVIENINRGGFGIIDKVECDDGHEYARKSFAPSDQFKGNQELCNKLKSRFIREVKTQTLLPSKYFMPIIFSDLNCPEPYFLMPIAEDVFSNEIENSKKDNKYPEGLGDILNALEFLHNSGLVHRDLKPQNILKHNGTWKLADFGLISQDKEILSQTITTSNNAFGTVMYCAPEQIAEFKRITPQADIYSFGAILHDIFSKNNRIPYSQLTAEGEIGYIIERCTKKDKNKRFKDIKLLRAKLLSFISKPKNTDSNEFDEEWITKFEKVLEWDSDTFESFTFYIKQSDTIQQNVFFSVNQDIVTYLHSLDIDSFYELSLQYLQWIYNRSFDFSYCDVVIDNIYLIYNLSSDIEVKSRCVISASELGRYHNRWYVMEYFVKMCNSDINDSLAFRIAMDIELETNNKHNFIKCVERISLTIESLHDEIKKVLK
ncbi:protein kinase [Tenacibaculum finnmarkense]|nr:protein kinase [Tenacibaculum finnmarkense]